MPRPAPPRLLATVAQACALPVADELQALVQVLRARFGDGLSGLLFYGSCLRSGDPTQGLVDLYVLVDDYASVRTTLLPRLADQWLPPTVFLLKTATPDGRMLRAKCALISLKDFEEGTTRWFQSYLWARFSQPSRLVYYRNMAVRDRVHASVANAVMRMMSQTLAAQDQTFSSMAFWERAFSLTYGSELRPENANRPAEIVGHNAAYYAQVTCDAAASVPGLTPSRHQSDVFTHHCTASQKRQSRRRWNLRRAQGRTLNVLRLIKSLFTFEDGVDYVIWKLERHLGEPVEVSPHLHRYPLIFCWPLLWRLFKNRRLR
ncbi:hypothetical protein YA0852_07910 [Pseudomonas synxantha]|uniref:Phosphatidate cytidylyltransferase n=2 Tax=Pseudomonas synxantha TaxID=47883 RepID=A0ABS0UEK7_9PSED|nr:hypothetical protein [Pseudomonas synxantha]MBI6564016.1 hypothetical protein [Pseudomonas synxantha]MBI6580446.1 hypothetical protein [Pseudomonas synxantha]